MEDTNMKSMSYNHTIIFFAFTIIRSVFSTTFGIDVYENIDQCPMNKAGTPPNCNIPYVKCDNTRRCFNNSKCYQVTKSSPWHCDCSAATTKDYFFAGVECEHSSTIFCDRVLNENQGSKFCTNSGQCVDITFNGKTHGGCECAEGFAGAHCQYLKSDIAGIGLTDEALFHDVGPNFWAYIPSEEKGISKVTGAAIGVSVCATAIITITFGIMLLRRKKIAAGHEKRLSMDPTAIEVDGSGSMKADGIL